MAVVESCWLLGIQVVLAHSVELANRLSPRRISFEDTKNGVDIRNNLKLVWCSVWIKKRHECYSQLTMKGKGNRNKRVVKDKSWSGKSRVWAGDHGVLI